MPPKVIAYTVVTISLEPHGAFAEHMARVLQAGWQPWGSPSIDLENILDQAFVKYEGDHE